MGPCPQAAIAGSGSALRVLQAEVQVKQTAGSAARLLTAAEDHPNFMLRAQQAFTAIGKMAAAAAGGGAPAPAPPAIRRLHGDGPTASAPLDLGDESLIEQLLEAVQAQVPPEQRVPLSAGALQVRPLSLPACRQLPP